MKLVEVCDFPPFPLSSDRVLDRQLLAPVSGNGMVYLLYYTSYTTYH